MRILCCDDKTEITDFLEENIINICKNVDINADVRSFNTAESLIGFCTKNSADILFLDIDLGRVNGIGVAKALNTILPSLQIIYITGYAKYVNKICYTNFENILIKPISVEKLRFVFCQAIGNVSSHKSPALILHRQNEIAVINVDDIVFIESQKRKILVYLKNGKIEDAYYKISEIFTQLPSKFIFFHRSYIVNMDYIKQITSTKLSLSDGHTVPIPAKKYKGIIETYMEYCKMGL